MKNYETCGIKYKDYDCFLEYTKIKDDLKGYKCLCCNNYQKEFDVNSYQKEFDEKLKKRSFNTYKFSNHDINKFILLFQKCVYPYEYVDDWKKFNEVSLPKKKDFYSHLKMEDITDADYTHVNKACKDFKINNLGEYHDL